MDTIQSLNTRPTLSRSQLLVEQLVGAVRQHEPFISTLHPDGLAFTGRILTSGQAFLDWILRGDKERAEADAATGAFTQTFSEIEQYVRAIRVDVRSISDDLKLNGKPVEARALRADYLLRQTRLSADRPGDLRAVIEQIASSNIKNAALLTSFGVPKARLERASTFAQSLPDIIDARRRETTEFEVAVRERDTAEVEFINRINPVLRRLANYRAEAPEVFASFASIISKFRDDLTAVEGDDFDDLDDLTPAAT
jgi:hypothetical protein